MNISDRSKADIFKYKHHYGSNDQFSSCIYGAKMKNDYIFRLKVSIFVLHGSAC